MNLKSQIQSLLDEIGQNSVDRIVLERAIIPVLLSHAKKLKKSHFYIWKDITEDQLVSLTMVHTSNLRSEKKVILAFAGEQDAAKHPSFEPDSLQIVRIPTINFLFQVATLEEVDWILFYPYHNNYGKVIELNRENLAESIREETNAFLKYIQELSTTA